jgi:hypothetical protein
VPVCRFGKGISGKAVCSVTMGRFYWRVVYNWDIPLALSLLLSLSLFSSSEACGEMREGDFFSENILVFVPLLLSPLSATACCHVRLPSQRSRIARNRKSTREPFTFCARYSRGRQRSRTEAPLYDRICLISAPSDLRWDEALQFLELRKFIPRICSHLCGFTIWFGSRGREAAELCTVDAFPMDFDSTICCWTDIPWSCISDRFDGPSHFQ